jgi:glycosyltransferase involved in cell wall biosynthesis
VVQFGTVDENWPRIGLEAMSAGVPLIVPDRGGWREMVHNGFSGYLCADADQVVSEVTHLALIESWRMDMIHQARVQVEQFADPERIWGKWEQLFEELG